MTDQPQQIEQPTAYIEKHRVRPEEMKAWFDSPVTRAFFGVIRERQNEIGAERHYYEGNAQMTQDRMSWGNGAGDMLQEILDMRDDGTIYFEEQRTDDEEPEQIGDQS